MIALMAFAMETHAQWKAYLSYYEPKEIEQANDGIIYVLASGGLFSYSTQDQEVRTYDKTTLLSDCQISHIAWCKSAKKLVIAYDDYNIDLLSQNDDVVNMPAYMNTSMTVDKTINSVDIHGNDAYISTNFGIVRLNVANASFTDTYQLGFRVDYSYIENTKFKLCQFWVQHGQSLNMGLGMYASGQIHIDTQGYRTWGPDHSRNSSMCNF